MKNKQTRVFLFETNDMLRLMREFMRKVGGDIHQNGSGVQNKTDRIQFNAKFEDATMLEGYSIRDAVLEFLELLDQTIAQLRLPHRNLLAIARLAALEVRRTRGSNPTPGWLPIPLACALLQTPSMPAPHTLRPLAHGRRCSAARARTA